MPLVPDSIVEITLARLARGGKAVGRIESGDENDGLTVFVAGGAPGERVRARLTEVSPRFADAVLVEVLSPSASRVKPPCPVVDRCGGCPWQHIEYAEQIRQKDSILRETLRRSKALSDAEMAKMLPFVASEKEFRYRSRITLQSRPDIQEVGYFGRGTHDFVAIPDCVIADERLVPFAKTFPSKKDRFQVGLSERDELLVGGGGFTQVNRPQNAKLQATVSELIARHAENRRQIVHWHLLDLYAGNGNLTFPVVEAVRARLPQGVIEATGVESSMESVRDARSNPRAQMCKFEPEGVEQWLARQKAGAVSLLSKKGLPLDEMIVLDPPRGGCDKAVMPMLARRKPSFLVYVSCDPMTLARDLQRFREACAKHRVTYEVESIQGFDMFPQTDHIEAVVALRLVR